MTLPSLTNTYIRSLKLYAKSYYQVFPFIVLLMLAQFLLNKYLPENNTVDLSFFLRMLGDIAATSFFFSFLCIVYYNYTQIKVSIADLCKTGLKRFIHVFGAYFIISLPIILTLALLELFTRLWMPAVITKEAGSVYLWTSLILIGIALMLVLMLFVFSFAAGIFIVIKKESALAGLRHSWTLIKPVWLDTFLLVILFGIINASLTLFFDTYSPPYTYLIITLLMSSFYPALMVIHCDNIEKLR